VEGHAPLTPISCHPQYRAIGADSLFATLPVWRETWNQGARFLAQNTSTQGSERCPAGGPVLGLFGDLRNTLAIATFMEPG